MEHFYSNLLISFRPDLPPVEHPAIDFIDFFSGLVDPSGIPLGVFASYFIDQGAPRKNTVEHLCGALYKKTPQPRSAEPDQSEGSSPDKLLGESGPAWWLVWLRVACYGSAILPLRFKFSLRRFD